MTEDLKSQIIRLARDFSAQAHRSNLPAWDPAHSAFEPGVTTVPYAGRVFDADEVAAAIASTLDFWLTLGPEGDGFEHELASVLGIKRSILVNSGSSANLVAFSALTSPKLGDRAILPGDEVITCAAGFPTTVAPIIQNGAVPVFLDNNPLTLNANLDHLEEAYVPGKTKAVMMAHTLGNPFDLERIVAFCRRHDLWLIEDNCDSLGSTYTFSPGHEETLRFRKPLAENGQPVAYPTGTFGDLSTQSFYPPHHLTLGEGGAVNIVRDMRLKVLVESFRDWGRDCWCASGKDNTCGKRFGWQLGELPEGYDHKYIYSHLGYNLKPLDIQAAIGRQQLKKLDRFSQARRAQLGIPPPRPRPSRGVLRVPPPDPRQSLDPRRASNGKATPAPAAPPPGSASCSSSAPAAPSPAPTWPGISTRKKSATACSSAATSSASPSWSSCARTDPRPSASSARPPAPTAS